MSKSFVIIQSFYFTFYTWTYFIHELFNAFGIGQRRILQSVGFDEAQRVQVCPFYGQTAVKRGKKKIAGQYRKANHVFIKSFVGDGKKTYIST